MKYEVEIEGLPDGWEVVAYRCPYADEYYLRFGEIEKSSRDFEAEYLIVEKIKPRRKVLEEISRQEYYRLFYDESSAKIYDMAGSYWKEIKEE